jgi:NAD(P)H-hydrate repair Nnr-like enzyme with NAD(P)H-hydrate dehydratase domain
MVSEIESLRGDIDVLQGMIAAALPEGAKPDDTMLRACTSVLADRRTSLAQLERLAEQ